MFGLLFLSEIERTRTTLDSWLELDGWTNEPSTLVHRMELPTYLLMMDNRCQNIFLQQFGMCLLSVLVSDITSMDGCSLGTSEVWLGPEPRWPDAYQKFLWTIQASCMSGAEGKRFPHEPLAFSVKTLTNARTGFSQSFGSSPKLYSTSLWKCLPCNLSVQFISLGLWKGWVENLHIQIDRLTI